MDSKDKYKVIGLMSGTSLDGLDLASCILRKSGSNWAYAIEAAQTVKYSLPWLKKLSTVHKMKGEDLLALHVAYGKYLGLLINAFIIKNKLKNISFISSHGHTVFHQPARGFTFQLGSGNAINAACRLPVVWDFRSLDVALGGQGAPLVPVGDKLLFHNYDACLNLGGIANISTESTGKRMAFDVCFVNMALNYVASKAGKLFDENGALAAGGHVNEGLLAQLYKVYAKIRKNHPSLGREFFEESITPLLDRDEISIPDRLRTLVESSALEIAKSISGFKKKKLTMLCTGGGAFNSFLMHRLTECCGYDITIIVPDENIVKFKEALVFAFLGVLCVRKEINCLRSVTGARRDSSSGVMIGFK